MCVCMSFPQKIHIELLVEFIGTFMFTYAFATYSTGAQSITSGMTLMVLVRACRAVPHLCAFRSAVLGAGPPRVLECGGARAPLFASVMVVRHLLCCLVCASREGHANCDWIVFAIAR